MKELTHSVRAYLLAGYVTTLLLLVLTAIGAATGASIVSHKFIEAVQRDGALMQDVLLHSKLMGNERRALHSYLVTHDATFLAPYTTARRTLPALRARSARLGTAVQGVQPLLASMEQRAVAWERWAQQLRAHPPAGPSSSSAGIAQQRENDRLFDVYRVAADRVLHHLQADQKADLHEVGAGEPVLGAQHAGSGEECS